MKYIKSYFERRAPDSSMNSVVVGADKILMPINLASKDFESPAPPEEQLISEWAGKELMKKL